jgi:hypothetical protein
MSPQAKQGSYQEEVWDLIVLRCVEKGITDYATQTICYTVILEILKRSGKF